jgi:hypothetical protein
MRFAETNSYIGGHTRNQATPPPSPGQESTIAQGRGMIATQEGYQQAELIGAYIPPSFDYDGLPPDTYHYRRFSSNSPAAIDLRCKAAAHLALWEKMMPKIIRGEE